MARSKKTRNIAIGGGILGSLVALMIGFWPSDAKADDVPKPVPDDETKLKPPYPLPRPYAESSTTCFRSGEPYNLAILETPQQASALMHYLGYPISVEELLKSDAMARTPIWTDSQNYQPKVSEKLKVFQGHARTLNLPGHAGATTASLDGVWGECTAVSTGHAAELQEDGKWPYKAIPRSANA